MNRMEQVHVKRLEKKLADARKWSAAWKAAAKRRKLINATTIKPLVAVLSKNYAELEKDRDSWKRRCLQLEAKRVEGLQPPYKFGGEGVA